ncbi:Crp/Fnr family transcriptional regulator [Bacteroides faecichinchillae]|uniref:Crp/Fnr family transcriptional regulator n=1 Tax=Bacteroides faecichinchillae TaxID=871325 RepID=UPI0035170A30
MKNFNHYAEREEFSAFKEFFLKYGQYKEIKKKEYFAQQGFQTGNGAYIQEGLFRYVCTDDRGCEHIVGYSFAGEYVGDYPACLRREKAMVSIQAATNSIIYYAPAEEMRKFFTTNEANQQLERILAEELFVQTYKRLLDVYCKTPTELYWDLVCRSPDFQNYITLREVASFLRVTPETISHIRKKIE